MTQEISNAQVAARFLIAFIIMAAAFFGSSGTVLWPEAWLFIVTYLGWAFVMVAWMKLHDPALLASRLRLFRRGARDWDKWVMALFALLGTPYIVLPGLDAVRFGWSFVPLPLQIAAFAAIVGSFWLIFRVMRANSFASPYVEVQRERGHRVIDTGPYAHVRHPMYLAIIIFLFAFPLWLGSLWTLILSMLITAVVVFRLLREEKALCQELEGYVEYRERVRYRLIPGIW